jgi:hypothetical protein
MPTDWLPCPGKMKARMVVAPRLLAVAGVACYGRALKRFAATLQQKAAGTSGHPVDIPRCAAAQFR